MGGTMSSVVISGDTSGSVTLQAPAVSGATTLTLPAVSGTVLTTASTTGINGTAVSTGLVAEAYGGTGTTTGYYGFKNRIINGAMGIWQRGTTYTPGSYYAYGAADRWCNNSLNTTYARSTDVPAGFVYSTSITGSSAAYPGITQRIESANCTDLVGQSVTVSAYIKKTTGTTLVNATLFYASATDNFGTLVSMGDVTLTSSPTSSWVKYTGTFTNLPAGAANGIQLSIYTVSGSSSDVMLITGVQLEKGATATAFDYRPYGTEFALCLRYYVRINSYGSNGPFASGNAEATTRGYINLTLPQPMRTNPTCSISNISHFSLRGQGTDVVCTSGSFNGQSIGSSLANIIGGEFNTSSIHNAPIGGCVKMSFASASGYIAADAEL